MTDTNTISDRDALISKQQLELERLKTWARDVKDRMHQIRLILVHVGGPLNDNYLCYNEKQKGPLRHIESLTDLTELETP